MSMQVQDASAFGVRIRPMALPVDRSTATGIQR